MDKNKSYNDIVEYYKNKNVNKKENITVDNTVSISYNEKVIIDDKELKQEQKENNNNNVEITKVKKDVETNTDENESTERK